MPQEKIKRCVKISDEDGFVKTLVIPTKKGENSVKVNYLYNKQIQMKTSKQPLNSFKTGPVMMLIASVLLASCSSVQLLPKFMAGSENQIIATEVTTVSGKPDPRVLATDSAVCTEQSSSRTDASKLQLETAYRSCLIDRGYLLLN
jgi:hypothetical protein